MRRRGAHERSANEPPRDAGEAQWPLAEDAPARLRATERESLVLHFFQDLSYPEMARVLSIGEAAARKRVSRALQSLETQLRRRGLGASATAILTAATAQQAAAPAQAGLAAAALAALPAAPLSIVIATLMSQTTAKIVCAAVLIATPLALEWKANAALRAEISKIRSANPELAALLTDTDSVARREAELQARLAEKHTARLAAENRVAELAALKNKVENEVVISFGSVDAMAAKLGSLARQSLSAEGANIHSKNETAEELAAMRAQFQIAKNGDWKSSQILYEIPRLERVPEKAARFYATLYGEMAGLDEDGRALVGKRALEWQRELQNDGLALPQRPKGKTQDWDARREAAGRAVARGGA